MKWYEEEDDKYSELYKTNYPPGDPFDLLNRLDYSKDIKVLDLGCGPAILTRKFDDYAGVDISSFIIEQNKVKYPDKKFYHASIHNLEFLHKERFDVVICADVMEHIPPDKVVETLHEINKLNSERFALSISTRPSVFLDKKGENLHLTIWPFDKWIMELEKLFSITKQIIKGSLLSIELEKKKDNIILIGNGPSALDRNNGQTIDNFDIVMRFNWYHIKGYEKKVGTKTDYWFTTVACPTRMKKQYKRVYEHSWEWDPHKDKNFQGLVQEGHNPIKTERELLKEIQEYVGDKTYWTYSSGAIAIWLLLKEHEQLTITGFDWWENRDKHHYGDQQQRGRIHKPEFEKVYIDKLLADNKIKFL